MFENIMDWWDWEAYSRDLNTHFDDLKKTGKTMPQGSTYDDWNLLENENLVHEIITVEEMSLVCSSPAM